MTDHGFMMPKQKLGPLDEPNKTKMICPQSISKQMVAGFFRKIGHFSKVPVEHRRTVNSEWFTTICLQMQNCIDY